MIYILIIVILFVCELAYFAIADKYNIIDKPNLRSSHTSITLRGGGIIFLIGTWIWAAFFGLQYGWFMAGLTLVGMISFIDDIHPLDNKIRLLGQFAAMMMLFANLGFYNAIGWWMVIPALIVCVGILNAFNFMDGINGITGGYALSVIIPIIYLNQKMQFINMPFLIVTAISLLVFCFFNFRKKAKCFCWRCRIGKYCCYCDFWTWPFDNGNQRSGLFAIYSGLWCRFNFDDSASYNAS